MNLNIPKIPLGNSSTFTDFANDWLFSSILDFNCCPKKDSFFNQSLKFLIKKNLDWKEFNSMGLKF